MADDVFIEKNDLYEIIDGEKIMASTPNLEHGTISCRLCCIIGDYLIKKNIGGVFRETAYVELPDGNILRPDVFIICDLSLIDPFGKIKCVPDLCVEVLSRSTMKPDRFKKKDIYERNGVKEYWIINPFDKSIEVYYLVDGKYELDEIYYWYSTAEWDELTDEEKAAAKFEIKVSLFDDLLVDVREVFRWWGEPLPVYNR